MNSDIVDGRKWNPRMIYKLPFIYIKYMIADLVGFTTSRTAVERTGLQYVPFAQSVPTRYILNVYWLIY